MRYWTLATVSALSAFAIFAFAGSLLARAAAATLDSRSARRAAASRARLLFRLRILPGLCAVTAAFGVALPIFLWFEDTGTTESVSRTLGLIACVGAGLLVHGLWRAAAAWRATALIVGDWQRRGRPLDRIDTTVPAFAIDDDFPIVAAVGVLRPRLFVAERVLRECAPDEIAAMWRNARTWRRDNRGSW